ncbi:MAG: molybdenum cofactor guanylyltransferase [Deltaproteobacteria bacterium]|nr:molybdenum cofactor guanylyltransferase [Candidatus Zymogenaceae bacterium]
MTHPKTGIILAGGSSHRMGTDKSFLDLGGVPIIGHVIRVMTSAFPRVLIITNDPDKYARFGLPMKADIISGIGTLGGIHSGLTYLKDSAALFVASDMPFIRPALIDYLVSAFHDTDAVVPYLNGEYEPLLAIYARGCLPAVEKTIASRKRRVVDFLSGIRLRTIRNDEFSLVDPDYLSIFNINTPEDYERAKRIVEVRDR